MKSVALIANLTKPNVHQIADKICSWLLPRGIKVYAQKELKCGHAAFALGEQLPAVDLIMVLGGDGTFLTVAGMYGPADIPLLGVNLGHLGFLTEVEMGDLELALEQLVQGEYQVEKRSMLSVRVLRQLQEVSRDLVLNDVVIAKGPLARIIHLEVSVDGVSIGSYRGDGLIVSTPTGSTGYSLSAGGPIVAPDVDVIIITPICPHTLNVRPIVVARDSVVNVEIRTCQQDTFMTLDGQQSLMLDCADHMEITCSSHQTSLVRLSGKNFFEVLAKKIVDQNR